MHPKSFWNILPVKSIRKKSARSSAILFWMFFRKRRRNSIFPDTIETGGTKRADVIKTHHNRVPAVQRMIEQGLVIEPLVDLYKVEVRELGETLGLPEEIVWRHPFPGPGLGIRLLCSDGSVDHAEKLPESQLALNALLNGITVQGAVLPVRSVGVKADLRSYEHQVMLW